MNLKSSTTVVQKYLRITYGGPVAEEELFLRHTYFSTLDKVTVWLRLTGATEPPSDLELRSVLSGSYFSQGGIQNFLEEDFFAWAGPRRGLAAGPHDESTAAPAACHLQPERALRRRT